MFHVEQTYQQVGHGILATRLFVSALWDLIEQSGVFGME